MYSERVRRMDKYVETTFMLIALGILITTGEAAFLLLKIHRELKAWRKEWKISQDHDKELCDVDH